MISLCMKHISWKMLLASATGAILVSFTGEEIYRFSPAVMEGSHLLVRSAAWFISPLQGVIFFVPFFLINFFFTQQKINLGRLVQVEQD